MICKSCEAAGELNQDGLAHMQVGQVRAAEMKFTWSELMHDKCLSNSCYCQHRTR